MRWRKHLCAAWDDEKVAKLIGSGGEEGLARYGLWCRVLDIVAAKMDRTVKEPSQCSATYPVSRWAVLLGLRGSLVGRSLSRLAAAGLATVERRGNGISLPCHSPVTPLSLAKSTPSTLEVTGERHGSEITVTIPKLLKYRDEYAQKSGHCREKVPSRTDTDTDTDIYTHTPRDGVSDAKSRTQFTAPTLQEVSEYMAAIGVGEDSPAQAERFVDHFEARGWVPKGYSRQMRDWKAAARTWKRNMAAFAGKQQTKQEKPIDPWTLRKLEEFNRQRSRNGSGAGPVRVGRGNRGAVREAPGGEVRP